MKHIKLLCKSGNLTFEHEANKLLEDGYEPVGSISAVYVEKDEEWMFTQPFGKLGMNEKYQSKFGESI